MPECFITPMEALRTIISILILLHCSVSLLAQHNFVNDYTYTSLTEAGIEEYSAYEFKLKRNGKTKRDSTLLCHFQIDKEGRRASIGVIKHSGK